MFLSQSLVSSFISALGLTVQLTVLSSVLALAFGLAGAFLTEPFMPGWVIRCNRLWVNIFRNTPLLVQLYIYYKGLPALGIVFSPLTCGVIGLSLYTSAYLNEIFRSGLQSISREQRYAAFALGLNQAQVYSLILVPAMLKTIWPSVTNQLISLTKNSSLVAFITVSELFYWVYTGAVDYFQPTEYFLAGAMTYMTLCAGIALISRIVYAGIVKRRWPSWFIPWQLCKPHDYKSTLQRSNV